MAEACSGVAISLSCYKYVLSFVIRISGNAYMINIGMLNHAIPYY